MVPAFPRSMSFTPNGDILYDQEGMSLRDYFAAAALPAVIGGRVATGADLNQKSIADECYALADALLARRQTERPMRAGGQMPPVPANRTISPGL